jgi:hypothetical protein
LDLGSGISKEDHRIQKLGNSDGGFLGDRYSVKLLSDSRKFITLNGGVTGVAGYEMVNKGRVCSWMAAY